MESKVGQISQENARITEYVVSQKKANEAAGTVGLDYGDLEACAVNRDFPGRIYVLSENAGALIGIEGIDDLDPEAGEYKVWVLQGPDKDGRPGMPAEVSQRDVDSGVHGGYGKGTGAEGLEFLSGLDEILVRVPLKGDTGGVRGYQTNLRLETTAGSQQGDWVQHNFANPGEPEELGQLVLVGHQHDGRIYVFEINPEEGGEFINHGYYETATNEVCGLHWDFSGSDLYIWHGQELGNPNFEGTRNSLEIWHLGEDEVEDRVFVQTDHFTEDVPGNKAGQADATNYESIALLARNTQGGAGPHQRVMFLVKDDEDATLESTPVRWFLLPHAVSADLDHDGDVDDVDLAIIDLAIQRGDLRYDVNGDGKVDAADRIEIFQQELEAISEGEVDRPE